jgi:hypothetical protein
VTTRKAGPKGPAPTSVLPEIDHAARSKADVLQRRMVILWQGTGNGRYAILAWQAARAADIPVAPVILEFIDGAFAQALKGERPHDIAAALHLAGHAKAKDGPRRFLERDEKIAIASAVMVYRLFLNDNATAAIAAVATERGLSVPRVKKAYYDFREVAPGF